MTVVYIYITHNIIYLLLDRPSAECKLQRKTQVSVDIAGAGMQ